MIICTLTGPDPRVLTRRVEEQRWVKPLQNGESYFVEKRRAGTLERKRCLVNGTLVVLTSNPRLTLR